MSSMRCTVATLVIPYNGILGCINTSIDNDNASWASSSPLALRSSEQMALVGVESGDGILYDTRMRDCGILGNDLEGG